jgi:hypothetical protein
VNTWISGEYVDRAIVDRAIVYVVLHTYELKPQLIERHKIMTITRGIAAAAALTAVAVGAAATAWADPPTMNGHYIRTETNPQTGHSQTDDWYVTPCGDGCVSVAIRPDAPAPSQARLVNGQWTLDSAVHATICPDGTVVPNAVSAHYIWDPNTLAGTVQVAYNEPACGNPAGHTQTNNVQLTQAP